MKIKKNIMMALLVMPLAILVTGCQAYFGNDKQRERGNWYGFAGSEETAQMKSYNLALAKLQAAPVQVLVTNGVLQGYKGLVANLSNRERFNFLITGPERKGFLLGPGEQVIEYLIPGKYQVKVVSSRGHVVSQSTFHVGVEQSLFLGRSFHWYAFVDNRW